MQRTKTAALSLLALVLLPLMVRAEDGSVVDGFEPDTKVLAGRVGSAREEALRLAHMDEACEALTGEAFVRTPEGAYLVRCTAASNENAQRGSPSGKDSGPSVVRAADGTPMVLEDGSPNLVFFTPPKSYRSPEGFQKARWGMSTAQVRKLFPKALEVKGRGLYVEGETAGLKTNTFFLFTADRLAIVSVQSRELHMSASKYLEDHKRLKDLLVSKYGAPLKDEEDWTETLFQDQPNGLHTALVLGHATLRTTWKTGESLIGIRAEGKDARVQVSVEYASTRLAMQLMNEAAKTEAEDL